MKIYAFLVPHSNLKSFLREGIHLPISFPIDMLNGIVVKIIKNSKKFFNERRKKNVMASLGFLDPINY
jgi:hypothetical protein